MPTLSDDLGELIKRIGGRALYDLFRNMIRQLADRYEIKRACDELTSRTGEKWTYTYAKTPAAARIIADALKDDGVDCKAAGPFVVHRTADKSAVRDTAARESVQTYTEPEAEEPEYEEPDPLARALSEKDPAGREFTRVGCDDPETAARVASTLKEAGIDSATAFDSDVYVPADEAERAYSVVSRATGVEDVIIDADDAERTVVTDEPGRDGGERGHEGGPSGRAPYEAPTMEVDDSEGARRDADGIREAEGYKSTADLASQKTTEAADAAAERGGRGQHREASLEQKGSR